MKCVVLIGSLLTAFTLNAQLLLPIQHDTAQYSQEIFVQGFADYSSTAMYNEMTSKLIWGGFIRDEDKKKSFDRHSEINRFGSDLTGELEYRNLSVNLFKNEKFGFLVKAGYYNYSSSVYAKDLFGLTFYGNERYLGEGLNFSGTQFSQMSFQKVGFGVIDKALKSSVTFNLYNISSYAEAYVRDGVLFQNESGDSVSLIMDGTFKYASSSNFNKGVGFGIDADVRIPVQFKHEKTAYVQLLVKNLGFGYINTPVQRYQMDTTINFEGFTFTDFTDENSILNQEFNYLNTFGIDSTETNTLAFLPGLIQVGKIIDRNSTELFQSLFGIRMYTTTAYTPLLYAGVEIKPWHFIQIAATAMYGGFSRFRAGMYINYRYKIVDFSVGSEDLYGLVSSNGLGKSLNFRLRCAF